MTLPLLGRHISFFSDDFFSTSKSWLLKGIDDFGPSSDTKYGCVIGRRLLSIFLPSSTIFEPAFDGNFIFGKFVSKFWKESFGKKSRRAIPEPVSGRGIPDFRCGGTRTSDAIMPV